MADDQAASQQVQMREHRGVLILVLGILGIVLCFICGIIAWVMGNHDLREMDAGRMDPSGRQMTQIGRILGIISVVLLCVWIIVAILWFGAFMAMIAGPG